MPLSLVAIYSKPLIKYICLNTYTSFHFSQIANLMQAPIVLQAAMSQRK